MDREGPEVQQDPVDPGLRRQQDQQDLLARLARYSHGYRSRRARRRDCSQPAISMEGSEKSMVTVTGKTFAEQDSSSIFYGSAINDLRPKR